MKKRIYKLLLGSLTYFGIALPMTFDNRYFPLYFKPYLHRMDKCSHVRLQPLFMFAEKSFGDFDPIGLPDIDGRYDLVEIAKALKISGRTSVDPLPSNLQGLTSISWLREGSLNTQGIALYAQLAINNYFSIGTSLLAMHINNKNEFFLDPATISNLPLGNQELLFLLKEQFNRLLGVTPPLFKKTVFGDGDFYLRFDKTWDYTCKFRHINLGVLLGMIAPFGNKRDLNNPASLTAGFNKHWGMYFGFDTDFELKEDWHVGVMARAIKRFSRNDIIRMPVVREPGNYGAIINDFNVDPGFTFVFSPSVTFEGLRDGLGVSVIYTLVKHFKDNIEDHRANRTIPVNVEAIEARSSWGMEHVTIQAFYDFAKALNCKYLPVVSLAWDMPTDWIVSERVFKTNCISLMAEIDF